MRQEDIFEKIRASAEDVPVPENLSPEQMMQKLPKKKSRVLHLYKYAAAAAIVLVALTVWQSWGIYERTMPSDKLKPVQEYGDVYQAIEEYKERYQGNEMYGMPEFATSAAGENDGMAVPMDTPQYKMDTDPMKEELAMAPSAKMLTGAGAEAGAGEEIYSDAPQEYSDTNVQVTGVDEGDVVKTDGSYLYVMGGDQTRINIIKADGASMKVSGFIECETSIIEFYLNGDKLLLITEDPMYAKDQTYVYTYDISDKTKPEKIGSVTQDGAYKTSRSSDGYFYLFTSCWVDTSGSKDKPDKYIPHVNKQIFPKRDIYIPDVINGEGMIAVSSVAWDRPGTVVDQTAILTTGDSFYVSGEYFYIGENQNDLKLHDYNYTQLLKFSYVNGKIDFKAKTKLNGRLNDQFSMDEYNGNLRVVTTLSYNGGWDVNALYIYNENLEQIGKVEDLAPGEQVYSARFMGDTGYFVTFRNMDPLFSVDLSDPSNPKILGELKIPGFSEYLHPYGDGLLWGIGQEIDPITGIYKGLKLSMFDTSSPASVKEDKKLVEPDMLYSPAWYNHKSVLVNAEKNVIGFSASSAQKDTMEEVVKYVVYSYDPKKGFEKRLDYVMNHMSLEDARGVFIGDYIYVAGNGSITSFSMDDYVQQSQINY